MLVSVFVSIPMRALPINRCQRKPSQPTRPLQKHKEHAVDPTLLHKHHPVHPVRKTDQVFDAPHLDGGAGDGGVVSNDYMVSWVFTKLVEVGGENGGEEVLGGGEDLSDVE